MDIAKLGLKLNLGEGKWIKDIPDMDGIELLVRSTNYKPFRVANAAIARKNSKKLKTAQGMVEFTVAVGEPLAEHILLGWKGVTEDGKPKPYSKEAALELLTSDDDMGIGDAYRTAVDWAGQQVADGLADDAKEAAGNSAKP